MFLIKIETFKNYSPELIREGEEIKRWVAEFRNPDKKNNLFEWFKKEEEKFGLDTVESNGLANEGIKVLK